VEASDERSFDSLASVDESNAEKHPTRSALDWIEASARPFSTQSLNPRSFLRNSLAAPFRNKLVQRAEDNSCS
jgi:hypothetical protein